VAVIARVLGWLLLTGVLVGLTVLLVLYLGWVWVLV